MTIRRLSLSLALLLWTAAVALGQTLSPEQRQHVLERLQQTVAARAFVPGVNFDRLPEYLARHQSEMDQAQDATAFTAAVNKALRVRRPRSVRGFTTGPRGRRSRPRAVARQDPWPAGRCAWSPKRHDPAAP